MITAPPPAARIDAGGAVRHIGGRYNLPGWRACETREWPGKQKCGVPRGKHEPRRARSAGFAPGVVPCVRGGVFVCADRTLRRRERLAYMATATATRDLYAEAAELARLSGGRLDVTYTPDSTAYSMDDEVRDEGSTGHLLHAHANDPNDQQYLWLDGREGALAPQAEAECRRIAEWWLTLANDLGGSEPVLMDVAIVTTSSDWEPDGRDLPDDAQRVGTFFHGVELKEAEIAAEALGLRGRWAAVCEAGKVGAA